MYNFFIFRKKTRPFKKKNTICDIKSYWDIELRYNDIFHPEIIGNELILIYLQGRMLLKGEGWEESYVTCSKAMEQKGDYRIETCVAANEHTSVIIGFYLPNNQFSN